jgi:hypothetical protein
MRSPTCRREGIRKLSRTVRKPLDQTDPLSLAAQKQLPRQQPAKPGFDLRTKWERLATILLPNSVAAHDTRRDVVDGRAKKFKENNADQNRPSSAGTAANALRMRCSKPPIIPGYVQLAPGVLGQSPRTPDQTNNVPRSGAVSCARDGSPKGRDPRFRLRDLMGLGSRQPGPATPDAPTVHDIISRLGRHSAQA